MIQNFVQDLVNIDFRPRFAPRVTFGRFTLVNNSMVRVQQGGADYKADLSLATDFCISGRSKRVMYAVGSTDWSGYNKKYITDEGIFDASLALAEFARTAIERRVVKEETLGVINRHQQNDSHEAFIYNMLISWMKAVLYSDNGATNGILETKTTPYSDSHAVVPAYGHPTEMTEEVELGPPVPDEAYSSPGWMLRTTQNYWSRPYVLHYNASGLGQQEFYLLHALGRKYTSGLNFDVPIEGINSYELLLDPLNGDGNLPYDFTEIPWDQPLTLWTWIRDYVALNRVEQHFAAALETLCAAAYQPCFSSLEACAWARAELVITLAPFCPTRARLRTVLEGDPYRPHAMAQEFMLSDAGSPNHLLVSSAVLNYYMWYGIYTLIHNEARSMLNWRDAYLSSSENFVTMTTPEARAGAISAITGKTFSTCMTNGAYFYVDYAPMAALTKIRNVVSPDGTVPEEVAIDAVYAPVSGSLIAGTIVDSFENTRHLSPVSTFKGHGQHGEVYTFEECLFVSNLYRLFGHDVILQDEITRTSTHPWASSRECIIEPASVDFSPASVKQFTFYTNQPRPGRTHILPYIGTLLDGTAVTQAYHTPNVCIHAWRSRVTPLRPYVLTKRVKTDVKFQVRAPMTYRPVQFTAAPVSRPERAGFRVDQSVVPPSMPEMLRIRHAADANAFTESTAADVLTVGVNPPPQQVLTTDSVP